ncbi:MAG: N-acetylmuramic acid 6-phosphate etherase [Candidatus Cybelea sp.]
MSSELPSTEAANAESAGLDLLETPALVALLVEEQRHAVDAVLAQTVAIARAVDAIAARLSRGGSLHYVGAGTSGRIATLDAAEMPPTFGTPPELVRAHIAGGTAALERSVEGAEDDRAAGERAMHELVGGGDAVVGISASGGAAFVVAAIESARRAGTYTLAVTNVENSPLAQVAEHAIVLATGPEALAGSTRLKAGTAQKIALNAISTAVMVRLGKVHDNLMVDLVASNAKLRGRALRLVTLLAEVGEERARELLDAAEGNVRVAVVMARRNLDAAQARALLDRHAGSLRAVL